MKRWNSVYLSLPWKIKFKVKSWIIPQNKELFSTILLGAPRTKKGWETLTGVITKQYLWDLNDEYDKKIMC